MSEPSKAAMEVAKRVLFEDASHLTGSADRWAHALDEFADKCVADDRERTLAMLVLACGPSPRAPHAVVLREFADCLRLAWDVPHGE